MCVCACLYRERLGGAVERKEKENISEWKINDAIPSFIPLVHECVCVCVCVCHSFLHSFRNERVRETDRQRDREQFGVIWCVCFPENSQKNSV